MHQEQQRSPATLEARSTNALGSQASEAEAHNFIKSIAHTLKVLVAEDDRITRRILTRTVEQLGHECVAVSDGESALAIFEERPFNVIISDWMMPGMDGKELCRQIRSRQGYTYFILLTALDDHQYRLEGMRAGADDFLTKPLNRDDLEARLIAAQRVTQLHAQIAEQKAELDKLNAKLFEDGRRDRLTGVGNRLKMDERIESLEAQLTETTIPLCVALVDIDCFKSFNDTAGHMAGDRALAAVAQSLERESRRSDAIYRFGGEEFVIFLPELTLDEAEKVLERVREAVQGLKIHHPGTSPFGVVTISIGAAAVAPDGPGCILSAIKRADKALYASKDGGRNRVSVSEGS
ncbi:MAG: diguanylate cyclase [Bradymonadia bacterium]